MTMEEEAGHVDGEENFGSCLNTFLDNGSIDLFGPKNDTQDAQRPWICGSRLRNQGLARGIQEQARANAEPDDLRISALHRDDPSIKNKITSHALKAVELFTFRVEIFQITDLLVNVTKHELKPKHQVLTGEDKTHLLKKYSIDEKQLPKMSQKDAIACYYNLEKGQVVNHLPARVLNSE